MITVKIADIGMLDTLLEWRERVLHAVFELDPGEDIPELMEENRRYYQRALPRGEHTACFALADDVIVGCGGVCYYQQMPSPENPTGTCAYLMNVYVDPAHRGKGVGRAITEWLVDEALQKGTGKIYLQATEMAQPLYIQAGFVPMTDYLEFEGDRLRGSLSP